MERQSAKADSATLFELSLDLLRYRNFSSSRRYALQALLSHPSLRWPHQILAVLHVLIAADHPITPHLPDWYSILQLHPLSRDAHLIREQFDKLSFLLNPLTNHFPYSQDALAHVREAWSLLSSPDKKALYDRRLAHHSSKTEGNGDTDTDTVTFWTLCPYCYCLFQYYRVYEDCCLRCQNCTNAFQAVMIPSPPKAVEGTDHHCCFGFFPLGFSGSVDEPKIDFVDISDDSQDSSGEKEKGNAVTLDDADKPKDEGVEKGDGCTGENIQTSEEDGELGVTENRGVEMAKPEEEKAKIGEDVEVAKPGEEKVETGEDGFLTPDVTKKSVRKKTVAKNTKKMMGTGKLGSRHRNIIFAMGTDSPNCKVGGGGGVEDGGSGSVGGLESGSPGVSAFTERGSYEEDDDIPLGVPISWDGWNGNFRSF